MNKKVIKTLLIEKVLFYSSISFLVYTNISSILNFRHIRENISNHLVDILHLNVLPVDCERYLGSIHYLPIFFLKQLFPAYDNIVNFAIYSTGLSFLSQHYFSFIFCFIYLQKQKQLQYLAFPLLSYAAGTMQGMYFIGSQAHQIGALLWPALFVLNFSKLHWKSFFFSLASIVGLSLTHEGALLALGILSISLIERFYQNIQSNEKRQVNFGVVLFLFAIAGIYFCFYRIKNTHFPSNEVFRDILVDPYILLSDRLLVFQSLIICFFILTLFFDSFSKFGNRLLSILLCVLLVLEGAPEANGRTSTLMRVSEIFFNCGLGIIFIFSTSRLLRMNIKFKFPYLILFFSISISAFIELQFNLQWTKSLIEFKNLQKTSSSNCIELPYFKIASNQIEPMPSILFPIDQISILLERSKNIRHIGLYNNTEFSSCHFLATKRQIPVFNSYTGDLAYGIELKNSTTSLDFSDLVVLPK